MKSSLKFQVILFEPCQKNEGIKKTLYLRELPKSKPDIVLRRAPTIFMSKMEFLSNFLHIQWVHGEKPY